MAPSPTASAAFNVYARLKNGTLEITFDAPETAKRSRRLEIDTEPVGGKNGETAA
jgi:hypothetical protein